MLIGRFGRGLSEFLGMSTQVDWKGITVEVVDGYVRVSNANMSPYSSEVLMREYLDRIGMDKRKCKSVKKDTDVFDYEKLTEKYIQNFKEKE